MYREMDFVISEPGLPFTAFTTGQMEVPAHWHTYLELLFVISGQALTSVSGLSFPLSQDDLLLINAGEVHDVRPLAVPPAAVAAPQPNILVIQFEPGLVQSNLSQFFETKYFLPFLQQSALARNRLPRKLNLTGHGDVRNLLHEILAEFELKQQGYELVIKADIYKLFAALIRKGAFPYPDAALTREVENSYRHIKTVLHFLESHYADPLRIEDMAEMAHLSYHHFCRTFRKATGRSFLAYLIFVRIGEAEKMLAAAALSITEIAYRCGFSSVSYFSKTFKKLKGYSPSRYNQHNFTKTGHK